LSPIIWTSIATGKRAAKHGIRGWVREGEDGNPRLYTSGDRRGAALWNILSSSGLGVAVVNWLNTFPPEKIPGAMISDWALPGEQEAKEDLGATFAHVRFGKDLAAPSPAVATAPVVYPAGWRERVGEAYSRASAASPSAKPLRQLDSLPPWAERSILVDALRNDLAALEVALDVDATLSPDVLMLYLPGIDRWSHVLWGSLEPPDSYPEHLRFSPSERRAAHEMLYDYYRFTDGLIGRALERFGPGDLVLIVSDHGFQAQVIGDSMTGGHYTAAARDGVIFARGRGIEPGSDRGESTIYDVTPTILAWLGIPLADDMDGRPLGAVGGTTVTSVPTYDEVPIERLLGSAQGTEVEIEDRIIEQLRGLGYVE
jgi:predicted AlkP superfamily phosphohydrolase/phosphomutase